MTFQELYRRESKKPTPRQNFLAEVAGVTKKSLFTVRQWANGIQQPDELTRSVLADHFRCKPEDLFPKR